VDLKLEFWGSGTARTLRPIWMAEELNLKYELNPIGPRTGETLTPEYSALNPKQKIPLIKHGDFLLSESVAICRYLQSISSTKITHSPENRQIQAKEDEWCNFIYGELDETSLYVMRRHYDLKKYMEMHLKW
jgi:glutathione S-transferase